MNISVSQRPEIAYTPMSLTVDGTPWFPLMGEMHYSRMARSRWESELLKMKAGGIDIVSSYCIWIHHEEVRGSYDFSGNRDLRAFLSAVKRCGLLCFLRIGPWAHGEVRNGGFPDWLVELGKSGAMSLRADDPAYLGEVRRFYRRLFREARGFFLKDGGPVIGIQIENEYGHCGGLTGPGGEEHMRTLTAIAKEEGFDAPLWTATGWGGAVTGGLIPVMGGYCEAPWDQRITEIEPSGNYIFTAERNDHAIGSDYGETRSVTFDEARFPYLTAELGGGLQVTKHRRPVVSGRDIEAMSLVKLGSGCSLLGYYMYHGGTNPEGRLSTLQESRETGYPNDLPVLSYDFNAPVREYGQLTDTWRRIRRLSLFLHDFGSALCRMEYIRQPGNPSLPEDLTSLRTAVRLDRETGAGYLFVNNYQRRRRMADHASAHLAAYGPERRAAGGGPEILADFGEADIRDGDYFFFPFNMPLMSAGGAGRAAGQDETAGQKPAAVLETARAIPLCVLFSGGAAVYVFYTDSPSRDPAYRTDRPLKGTGVRLLTLSAEDALRASKVAIRGNDYLVISDYDLVPEVPAEFPEAAPARGGQASPAKDGAPGAEQAFSGWLNVRVKTSARPVMRTFPELPSCPSGFRRLCDSGDFAVYEYGEAVMNTLGAELTEGPPSGAHGADPEEYRARVRVTGVTADPGEALLLIRYEGESAELREAGDDEPLRGDRRAADNFYTGQVWEVGVDDFARDGTADFDLTIRALREDAPVFLETRPPMNKGTACRLLGLETEAVRRVKIRIG